MTTPKLKKVSPVDILLMNTAVDFRQSPDDAELAYMARQLVQCTLPHSDPGSDLPTWERTNGGLTLTLRPMLESRTKRALYPFGSYPRLLLFWIVTEATRTKSRRLVLGNSLSEFMDKLGLPTRSGGKRGAPKRLREQMTRLLRATISFDQTYGSRESWLDMQIGPRSDLWWNPSKDAQDGLFESWIELGEHFYQAVTANPVPVDMRALRGLKKSPLALDLYAWLSYKTFVAQKSGKAQAVSWEGLHAQIGAEYAELRDFKKKVLRAVGKIRLVYPGLDVDVSDPDSLIVKPGRTAISPRKR